LFSHPFRFAFTLLLAVAAHTAAADAAGPAAPQRVLSLNLCTDQLLMALVPAQRIVSITWLSRTEGDPALLSLARQLPVNHGSPEEVLAARPDLVLAGKYTTANTRALLQRVGIRVLEVDPVTDWAGIRRVTQQVATALGAEAKGRQLLDSMDADLAQLARERTAQPVRVIGWGGGAEDVPGRDTLFNTILESAGGINLAALDHGPRSFDLEQVLLADPQVVMRGAAYSGKPSLRNFIATHRVLRARLGAHMVTYPEAVYGCGVPRASRVARDLAVTLRAASSP
jgi:iron complex transport system substrate-binding protein